MTFGLDLPALLSSLGIVTQIFVIDLLLSADNALLIAMAVRTLPPNEMRTASAIGTAGAIVLRIVMAGFVVVLLDVPYVKLVAGVLLLGIALKLTLDRPEGAEPRLHWRGRGIAGAVAAIMVADAVMSLDNVVAIAAVADGSLLLLGFGLLLSIPMLVYGSGLVRQFLVDNGLFVLISGMFLGWLAGRIGVSDPAVAAWIDGTAPALAIAVPVACAAFVLWEHAILSQPARST